RVGGEHASSIFSFRIDTRLYSLSLSRCVLQSARGVVFRAVYSRCDSQDLSLFTDPCCFNVLPVLLGTSFVFQRHHMHTFFFPHMTGRKSLYLGPLNRNASAGTGFRSESAVGIELYTST
ncbi:unnamed protein product, partial [Ectocarpus sp. 13 AM-2016]